MYGKCFVGKFILVNILDTLYIDSFCLYMYYHNRFMYYTTLSVINSEFQIDLLSNIKIPVDYFCQ